MLDGLMHFHESGKQEQKGSGYCTAFSPNHSCHSSPSCWGTFCHWCFQFLCNINNNTKDGDFTTNSEDQDLPGHKRARMAPLCLTVSVSPSHGKKLSGEYYGLDVA